MSRELKKKMSFINIVLFKTTIIGNLKIMVTGDYNDTKILSFRGL